VKQPQAHNLVLIDRALSGGDEPIVVDAVLGAVDLPLPDELGDRVQRATASVDIGAVRWTRTVTLVGTEALVTFDQLAPTDGAQHTYALTWHGNGLTLDDVEGTPTWATDTGDLVLAILSTAETTRSQRLGEHAFVHSVLAEHAVLTVSAEGEAVDFVTVAVPPGADAPLVEGDTISWRGGSVTLSGRVSLDGTALPSVQEP